MSISDSLATTAQQMIDLARRNQREVVALRNALADEQDRRRRTQGELNMLRERLTRTLDRIDADEDLCDRHGADPDFSAGADHVILTIRKELNQ